MLNSLELIFSESINNHLGLSDEIKHDNRRYFRRKMRKFSSYFSVSVLSSPGLVTVTPVCC